MFQKFLNRFKDDRKYFTIVFFIIVLILLTGIITPILIDQTEKNWNVKLSNKIIEIENEVVANYKQRESRLLKCADRLKTSLHEILSPQNPSYGNLIKLINSDNYSEYSIEIVAPNGRIIAWNNKLIIPQDKIFPLNAPAGEVYFYNTDLISYLSLTDTIQLESDLFYFLISIPFEKHYTLHNDYYTEVNFIKEISDKYLTQFEIAYSPFAEKTKDGRKYSFDLLNNNNKKIAVVTFIKPALSTNIRELHEGSANLQSILTFLACIFFGLGLRKDYNSLKYRWQKLLVVILYFAGFRSLLFLIGFPSTFLTGALVDPAYFSSAFGGGIVKSPVEFLISVLFVAATALTVYNLAIDYLRTKSIKKNYFYLVLTSLPLTILFLLTARSLYASVKSVIFDSTLKYFKEPTILPNFPSVIMNINVLLLGFAVLLLLSAFVIVIISLLPEERIKRGKFLAVFFIFQIFGLLFFYIQNQPLITLPISVLFITLVFLFVYRVYFVKTASVYNYVYAMLGSSIVVITLLMHFNLELEKESLKTTALEIDRSNDNYIAFLINETLTGAADNQNITASLVNKNVNYNALAFNIWSSSPLQRESVNSEIILFNRAREIIGKMNLGLNTEFDYRHLFEKGASDSPLLLNIEPKSGPIKKLIGGIITLRDRNRVTGYLAAIVGLNMHFINGHLIPDFLKSRKNVLNPVIDESQLKIFQFENGNLINVFGDIYPSIDQNKPILNAHLSVDNDAWLYLALNDDSYITYILKSFWEGNERVTAVSLREKHISWNLFNFFKIFILHVLLILCVAFILFLTGIKSFKYTFRTQLLTGFLIISILPVILLSVYNRQIVKQRTEAAIFNELNERVTYIESHIKTQLAKYENRSLIEALKNAEVELDILFSVYDQTDLIYDSKEDLIKSGLFDSRINSEVYYQLFYLSYREHLTKHKIENFAYDAFYKKIKVNDKNLVIAANNAVNKIKLPLSTIDIDVFLFGVYAFATLIIIILSTVLANKFSSPIRRLTKATASIGHGDLSVELENKERGELKELIDGFNSMTKELQKNQVELAQMERESAWKEMAKQVAHEIKNPLTPMKLSIQQLMAAYRDKNKDFDSLFQKLSSTVLSQIDNLSQIASEFYRFAKMPSLKLEEVDILQTINDTVNLFMDENIKIEVHANVNSSSAEADRSQLRRMMINLIRNSIQAGAKKIIISIIDNDSSIKIEVKDNGSGIAQQFIEKIFEPNFTTKEKGMGLGLNLVKRFLDGINGSISLAETSQDGTIFRIIIPKTKPNQRYLKF
jgi:signal transduction histidine kinase